MTAAAMWPFGGEVTPEGRHRVVHIWSTRWHAGDEPVSWPHAQELRRLAREREDDASFGTIFEHQLARQYRRVADRVPHLAGAPEPVRVLHGDVAMDGHCFVARLPSGHLLACVNVTYDGSLSELPSLLIEVLDAGPQLELHRDGAPQALEACVNDTIAWTAGVREQARRELPWARDVRLALTSEMHSLVYASTDDPALFGPDGRRDEQLIARLIGRLRNDAPVVKDAAILWPNEFNKLPTTIGAVRPGASLVAGADRFASRNAMISTLLLMGAASLLREARDEVYAVQRSATTEIQADVAHLDWRGRGPLGQELTRIAHVEIAVAFDVESHLDMRRLISDANLVQWHACFAESLAIPQSVAALHDMAAHLVTAMQTVSQRSTARNAFILSALATVAAALAIIVSVLLPS